MGQQREPRRDGTPRPASAQSPRGERQPVGHKTEKGTASRIPSLEELDRIYGPRQRAQKKKIQLWNKPPREAYADALAEHRRNHALARSWIQEGARSSDEKTKNVCEWILARDKIKLYSLTATHDLVKRAKRHGDSRRMAYFSSNHDVLGSDAGDYDFDINSKRNIVMSAGGILLGNKMLVVNTGGKDLFMSTFVHEMSHAADRTGQMNADPEGIKKHYATEFRAWYHTPGENFGSASKPGPGKWRNERQWKVFEYIYPKYEHVKRAWDSDPQEKDFRKFVYGFDMHNAEGRGPNLLLSVRIERFIQALESRDAPKIQTSIAALRPNETQYIKDNFVNYGRWIDKLPHQMQAIVYTAFGMTVELPPVFPKLQ